VLKGYKDIERSCIIVFVSGVERQLVVLYKSMCFKGKTTVSGNV
jgi:hypothetical protein